MDSYDIAIVGAGIAGASLASQLAPAGSVIVLEAEDRPGYHATGRSVAFWTESYGGPKVQPLTEASGPFLREHGFLSPRGALTIGRAGQGADIDAFVAQFSALGVDIERYSRDEIERRIPGLKEQWTCGAMEPDCCDIDVAALHQHYLAAAQRGGAIVATRSQMVAAQRDGSGWLLTLGGGRQLRCGILVNAAGAWADTVAQASGVRPLGLTPLRRTVVQLTMDVRVPADLPLVLDMGEDFYFKPDSGGLWLSPLDETPSPACDAAPEELDIAVALDRLADVVNWPVRAISHRWAGLRTFAGDRLPVYGFDGDNPRFFWFAGQGGFGIQTAPAAASLAACVLGGSAISGIDPGPFAPQRLARG